MIGGMKLLSVLWFWGDGEAHQGNYGWIKKVQGTSLKVTKCFV